MTTTTFTNGTLIVPSWMQDVNDFVYSYATGTWIPVLTFATPGNLSVAYSTQVGTYTRVGRRVTLTCDIVTSSFTHSTASGSLTITGLPFTSITGGATFEGPCRLSGYTNATSTSIASFINTNSNVMMINGSGSGVAGGALAATDMPTGGTVTIRTTITYFVQ